MQVTLSETDSQELSRWVGAHRTPQQVVQRCRIILAAAAGKQDKDIAMSMQINYKTVALWRQRFCSEGPDCLWEVAAGRGRKPHFTATARLVKLSTPHYKPSLQVLRTGVAVQWLRSKA